MEKVLETLNNLTPVLIIGSLALFMTVEKYLPYFEHGIGRGRQRWNNIGMIAIAFIINAVVGSMIAIPIIWSQENNFGLMHRFLGQSVFAIIIGIFLIDLTALYCMSLCIRFQFYGRFTEFIMPTLKWIQPVVYDFIHLS